MAGKCKYCGFFGTQDEIVDHDGEMCQGDCQPDTMVKNFTTTNNASDEIFPTCSCGKTMYYAPALYGDSYWQCECGKTSFRF